MKESRWLKVLVTLAAVVLVGSAVLRLVSHRQEPPPISPTPSVTSPPSVASKAIPSGLTPLAVGSRAESEESDDAGMQIFRERVEEYLQKRNRSAASLLAGYHALSDTNLLNEAAAKFPNDPHVQWAMLTSEGLGGEQRRQWLEAFKASSPDNALANYWSAAEHFKAGNQEAALKEMVEASGKKQFKDFAMETMIDEQELRRSAGQSAFLALHAGGWASALPNELSPLKAVASGIVAAQAQYAESGDAASAASALQMGFVLADRLGSGDGGRFLLNQQMGLAIENSMLKELDPNTQYDFLGDKTPVERQEELKQLRTESRELMTALSAAYGSLSEEEWVSYSDRMKAFGELEALRWLQQRTAPTEPIK